MVKDNSFFLQILQDCDDEDDDVDDDDDEEDDG